MKQVDVRFESWLPKIRSVEGTSQVETMEKGRLVAGDNVDHVWRGQVERVEEDVMVKGAEMWPEDWVYSKERKD